jgi:hypothetical protein
VFVACPQHPLTLDKVRQFILEHHLTEIAILFDEAHHTVESWVHTKDATKRFFLFDDRIQYRIFTSASPEDTIINAHPQVFGDHYSPISVSDLIAQKWLCPIVPYIFRAPKNNVNICTYALEHFTKFHSTYGFSFHHTRENASQLFMLHVGLYIQKDTHIRPYLLVGDDYKVKQRDTIAEYPALLGYNCFDIHTYESTPNSLGYVCQKFAMGYDFPKIDYLLLCDPKTSVKDVKQCIGRGTRPDKCGPNGTNLHKKLHVILPVYIDSNDDRHDYQCIRQVLRYLIFDIGICLKDMVERMPSKTTGGSTLSRTRTYADQHDKYDGVESMEAMLLNVLKDSSSHTASWTANRLSSVLQKYDTHDYNAYLQLRSERPELFLPEDPFLACNKQFRWLDTHKSCPYYNQQQCKVHLNKLVDTHDLDLDDMDTEDVVKVLHQLDGNIPPMSLERFYGVQMY